MNDFVNYEQAKDILQNVKSYVDSHGGGGTQKQVFYNLLCRLYSEGGCFYFQCDVTQPLLCELWANGRRVLIERSVGTTYPFPTIVYEDEYFEDDLYFVKNSNDFYIKDCYSIVVVRVLSGRLLVQTGSSSFTEIPTTTEYNQGYVSENLVYWNINCYTPESDPFEGNHFYMGKYRAWQFVNNSNVIETGLYNVRENYYIDIINNSSSDSNVEVVLPSIYNEFNVPLQRMFSFHNNGKGKKHIKIMGKDPFNYNVVIYEGELLEKEVFRTPIFYSMNYWSIGNKY